MNPDKPTHAWSEIDRFTGNQTSSGLSITRPCPVCGSKSHRPVLLLENFQFFSDSATLPKRVDIREVQCNDCHALFLNPCYSTLGFEYLFAEAGQSYGATEGRPAEQIAWLEQRSLLQNGKMFLDAGCYDGRFLNLLPGTLRRFGVDIDLNAIERGRAMYGAEGITLIHGAFESFACPTKADVITMFHVLEHLANPLEVLRNLHAISHEETRLVVEVPVLEFGKTNDINGFMSVQHMTHFSQHSLQQILARAGWRILERHQMPDYNGHRVLATPCSPQEGGGGDVTDCSKLFDYLEHWYRSLAKVARKIEDLPDFSQIVIWGGGLHTEFVYQTTPLFRKNPSCRYLIVDSDPVKQGKSWRGIPILSPAVLQSIDWKNTLLLISSYGAQERIADAAVAQGVPASAIARLYDAINVY